MSSQDVLEITQLIHQYNQAADSGDGAAFASTFVAEGEIELPDEAPIVGTEALRAFGDAVPDTVPGARHWVNNIVVDVADQNATARTYLIMVIAGNPPTLMLSGIYQDELVRNDDGWRFVKRSVTADG